MQLCAIDAIGDLVRAVSAERHVNYCCVECGQVVRMRKGFHRQAHYYHLQPNRACRLSGKSLTHLSVQNRILDLLPPEQADMEVRFDTIGRIADVVWTPQKIVFEIQCATITAEEVLARNASYASVGYDVVWILHTNRYNKVSMTSAEDALKARAHYFTDIDTLGSGIIYDQYAIVERARRIWRFPPTSVDITAPFVCAGQHVQLQNVVPKKFLERYEHWTRGFGNDYLDSCLKKDIDDEFSAQLKSCFARLRKEESSGLEEATLVEAFYIYFQKWIIHPYMVVLRHFLEKASR